MSNDLSGISYEELLRFQKECEKEIGRRKVLRAEAICDELNAILVRGKKEGVTIKATDGRELGPSVCVSGFSDMVLCFEDDIEDW